NFELTFQTKFGKPIHTIFSSKPMDVEGESCHVTTMIDITDKKKTEEALIASEEKFAKAFQSSPDIIVLTSVVDGRIIEVNDALQKTTGYSTDEVVGRTSNEMKFWANTEDRERYTELLQKDGRVRDLEVGFRIKSGEIRDTLLSGGIIQLKDGKYILGVIRDITERKRAEDELKRSREELRSLSAHLQSVREEERTILAREMHDEIGQILTSIKMNLSLLNRDIEKKEKNLPREVFSNEIKSMSAMVDHAVVRVRKMITELRPELLDKLGLIPALEWYTEEFGRETKIKCKFISSFEKLSLDHQVELTIFRIVQEALTNVAKHSNAKHASVKIEKTEDSILVTVNDDGKGIAVSDLRKEKSFGLLGMRERVNLIGGKIDFIGIKGKGTTVKLVIGVTLLEKSNSKN
ncbi:MAG: PAS domain S-box protein, partial [Melioribacter sp.]|nr:PAS domain S-box protein [Melioribacter sp.]